MKRVLTMLTALAFLSAPAFANEAHEMNVDKKTEKLKTELGLSDDQANQVKTVLNEYKDKAKALKDEKKSKIDAILTAEQKDKHEKLMKEWKDKKKDKHDHDDND